MAKKRTPLPELPPERDDEPDRMKLAREIHWMLKEDPTLTYNEIAERLHYSVDYIGHVARQPVDNTRIEGVCMFCGGKTTRNFRTIGTYKQCRKCYEERNPPRPCGTHAAYQRGCRCKKCKAANAALAREQRRQMKLKKTT